MVQSLGLSSGLKDRRSADERFRGISPAWMDGFSCLFIPVPLHLLFQLLLPFLGDSLQDLSLVNLRELCTQTYNRGNGNTNYCTALLMEGGNGKYYSPHKQMENGECQLQTKLQLAHMK